MGNHSDTGELLEEAQMIAVTEGNVSFGDIFTDEFGNTIKLDRSPEELEGDTKLANPTKLKDSSGRDVELMQDELSDDGMKLTPKQADAIEAKRKNKKAS
jgi:hypothetical protein